MMITTGNNNKMNKNIIDTWIELEKRSHIKKEKEKIKPTEGKKKPQRKGKTVQHNEKKNKKQNKTRSLHAICTKGTKTLKERARGIACFNKQKPIQPISLSSSLVYIFLEKLYYLKRNIEKIKIYYIHLLCTGVVQH